MSAEPIARYNGSRIMVPFLLLAFAFYVFDAAREGWEARGWIAIALTLVATVVTLRVHVQIDPRGVRIARGIRAEEIEMDRVVAFVAQSRPGSRGQVALGTTDGRLIRVPAMGLPRAIRAARGDRTAIEALVDAMNEDLGRARAASDPGSQ